MASLRFIARRHGRLLELICLLFIVLWALNLVSFYSGAAPAKHVPLGWDFVQHYVASQLVMSGQTLSVYDYHAINSAERQVTGFRIDQAPLFLLWNYPPIFLLFVAPLSLLPYLYSFLLWIFVSFAAFLLVIYKILPHRTTLWTASASPAVFWTFLHGQNSFIFASLLGSALILLDRNPVAAGICFAVISCKPQLFIVIPFALAAGRQWKALISMVLTIAGLVLLSVLTFGLKTWSAYLENASMLRHMLEVGQAPFTKMITEFSSLRLMGVSVRYAYVGQIVCGMLAIGSTCYVWSVSSRANVRYAVTGIATLLTSPYLLLHDTTVLVVALAFFGRDIFENGRLRYENIMIVCVWGLPLYGFVIAQMYGIQCAPYVLGAWLIFLFRRARNDLAAISIA